MLLVFEEIMLSKVDSRKKAGVISETDKFRNDLEAISNASFADKTLPPRPAISVDGSGSKSFGKSQLPESKTKPKNAKDSKKDSSDKEKKPSFWSWKGLKALTNARNRRFNCCFSLLVHSIEGLPTLFDDLYLVVHWKRKDSQQMTRPVKVYQGVAMFEEQLTHSCSINGSRSGLHQLAKYESKHFFLYASVYNAPGLDLGKHRIDITRLFPLTFEELEEEKSSGKWTTSFRLSGKARDAALNVSFGYVIGSNAVQTSRENNFPKVLSLRQNSATEIFLDQFDNMEDLTIRRVGSLPARLSVLNQSPENMKDLREVLPLPSSELCESVNVDKMSNASANDDKLDADPFPSHVDLDELKSRTPLDSGEKNSDTELEITEFSVVQKGVEEFTQEQMQPEEDPVKIAQASGEALETDGNAIVEAPLDVVDPLNGSAEEILSSRDEQLTCTSTERNNEILSKESLMKELEMALSYATNLMNELIDSQEDESAVSHQESSLDINSHLGNRRAGESLILDDFTDSMATDFFNLLGIEHSPLGLSSESEPDSPRERLLRQFEKDVLANGGLLNFDIDNEPKVESTSEALSNNFCQSSIYNGFQEMEKIETPEIEPDAFKTKIRKSTLEGLETEALMRDWRLNERASQHSPPSKSSEFSSPVGMHTRRSRAPSSSCGSFGPFCPNFKA